MAQHIWAIRNSLDEIAMTSYLGPKAQKNVYENPPPVGILYISDVKTHTELSQRSPFLGLLLPIADSPPDDEIWVYFLAKAQQVKIEESEGVEAPIAKSTQRLMIAGLIGDQS